MTFSSAFWTKFLQVLAAVRGDTGLCCCEGRLLDKALLVLALGVDRGLRLVDLLAARQGEGSKGEGGREGSNRKLWRVSRCPRPRLKLVRSAEPVLAPVMASPAPSCGFLELEPHEFGPRWIWGGARDGLAELHRTFRGGARGSTYDVRSDLAAGDSVHSNHFGGRGVWFGVRRRVMGAQWMEVVNVWMAEGVDGPQG